MSKSKFSRYEQMISSMNIETFARYRIAVSSYNYGFSYHTDADKYKLYDTIEEAVQAEIKWLEEKRKIKV